MNGTAVDIDVKAVKIIMDLEEVRDQRECMDKVQLLAWTVIGERAKRKKQDEQSS